MQYNLTEAKNKFVKYAPYVAILFIVLYFTRCDRDDKSEAEKNQWKREAAQLREKAKEFKHKAEMLEVKNARYKDTIAYFEKDNVKKEIEIALLYKKNDVSQEKAKRLTPTEIADYYTVRYNVQQGVTTTKEGTCLKDSIARLNIGELIKFDVTRAHLKIAKEISANKDTIISQKDSIIETQEIQKISLFAAVESHEKAANADKEIIKNVEKSLRRQKMQTVKWKVISAGILTAAGYLLIVK